MTAPDDRELVSRFYQARGDRAVIDQVMSPDVVWDITPGFPLGGAYHGLDAVVGDFLRPLGVLFSSIAAVPEQWFADGEGDVVAVGHYRAVSLGGREAECRFVHIWTITGGQLAHLCQTADSGVLRELLKDSPR